MKGTCNTCNQNDTVATCASCGEYLCSGCTDRFLGMERYCKHCKIDNKKDLSFEQMHYEKLLDDKRFQVAKDLFVLYCQGVEGREADNAKYAIRDADIFMNEFLKAKE